jgi:small subunit ribosomal protein S4
VGRDRSPIGKKSRNLNTNLAETPKIDALMKKRPYPSGQHGQARKKISDYAVQLQEKQRLKLRFGLREKQLRRYYEAASRRTGNAGTLLLQTLELRLDNIIFRAGLASTRPQARQMVSHGHVLLNGKKLDIASALCRVNDIITIRERSQAFAKVVAESKAQTGVEHAWLLVDREQLTIRVARLPEREDMDSETREQLVIEYYSR